MLAVYLSLPFLLWFFYLACFSSKEYKVSFSILAMYWAFYLLMFSIDFFKSMTYLDALFYIISIDGVASITLLFYRYEARNSVTYAVILCCAVFMHTVISLYLITNSEYLILLLAFLYDFYNELIVLTMILQLMASRNGINSARINSHAYVQKLLSRPTDNTNSRLPYLYRLQKESSQK